MRGIIIVKLYCSDMDNNWSCQQSIKANSHHDGLWFDLASDPHKMIVYVLTLYGQSLSITFQSSKYRLDEGKEMNINKDNTLTMNDQRMFVSIHEYVVCLFSSKTIYLSFEKI